MWALNCWENEINTTSPEYYRWNQWLFLKLFEKGLAYKKKSLVNWCNDCQTVISNEQVIDWKCERHWDTDVEKKEMEQWFLKITDFADDLYSSLDNLDWSHKTKITQQNWIWKKEWFNLKFQISWLDDYIETFTTRIDTIHWITFLAISCDGNLSDKLINDEQKELLSNMRKEKAFSRKDNKEWILTDTQVIHPITWELIPVFIANYVEWGYWTWAVMWVPWCDLRDKEFANKYKIEIKDVYNESEELINSWNFTWLNQKDAIPKISDYLEKEQLWKKTIEFKLRDWCISRQRYWWTPIPMINCGTCWIIPEKENKLPIKLPIIEDYKLSNNWKSPLSLVDDFVKVECSCCWWDAERETDVMDNFFDSSWYFFRYLSAQKDDWAFDKKRVEKWLPIDTYIWWNEHAVLHLMYTRFITKFLHSIWEISFDEPFKKFFAHWLIVKDGKKMSKSKWNVINPDEYIKKYWADALRLYLMFLGPLEKWWDFTDTWIISIRKFIWKISSFVNEANINDNGDLPVERKQEINLLVSGFEHSMWSYKYNVAISKIMTYFNNLKQNEVVYKEDVEILLKTLSIFCPYFTEELWNSKLDNKKSIHMPWWLEKYDNIDWEVKMIKLAVQIWWKVRGVLEINPNLEQEEVLNIAKGTEKIAKYLDWKTIKKVIYVKWRILNIVIN